jgi:sugar lactone lactonase YvrE
MKVSMRFVLTLLFVFLMSVTVFAQDATEEPAGEAMPPEMGMPPLPEGAEVVAEGLDYPRQLTVGEDGTIYVAVVGAGGDIVVTTPEGEVPFGYSAKVVAIAADGTQTPVLSGLPSAGGIGGITAVEVTAEGMWVVVSGPGPEAVASPLMASALWVAADGHVADYVDFYGYEVANDPDGNGQDTNPNDALVASDGTVYLLDTGANTLFTWTAEGGLVPFVVWPDNPVPTAVAEAPDGNLVVSFLGAELAPGAGKVEVISPEGEVVETYSGYTTLTDVDVAPDGTIYAVALISGFGEQGPLPGQVLQITGDGGTVIADGLVTPYGIAVDNDGSLLVTTGSAFLPPASGMVLRLHAGM